MADFSTTEVRSRRLRQLPPENKWHLFVTLGSRTIRTGSVPIPRYEEALRPVALMNGPWPRVSHGGSCLTRHLLQSSSEASPQTAEQV